MYLSLQENFLHKGGIYELMNYRKQWLKRELFQCKKYLSMEAIRIKS